MKVYELQRSIQYNGEWRPTGNLTGTLYRTIERAQAQTLGGEWVKDDRRRVWRDAQKNIICERKVVD